ncbi:MAG TPA: GNAT family N-acetyltransferase [Micromonosporaceae bacterium]
MLTIARADGYEISIDPARLDLDLVHRWLSTDAYWALGRPHEVVVRAAETSLLFGVYARDGTQVAVARAVTDSATFAWLCDVYVARAERGRGLGSWLVGVARDELRARGVRRILLATADAHGLYAKHGFAPLAQPERWMELTGQ